MKKLVTFVLAIGLPVASAAQEPTSAAITEVRRNARGHAGPFYFTPRLLVKELGVDSNVFNEAGEQKSDFTATVAPKLDVWVPVARRALLRTTFAPDMVWYAEYDTERSINPDVSARGEVYLSRITLFAEQSYTKTRQRFNYDVDSRSRHVAETTTAGVSIGLGPRLFLEIAGQQADVRYDAAAQFDGARLQTTLNRETQSIQIAAKHRLTPLTTLAARYDTRTDRFELSPHRNAESYRIMPGVEFKPQALIKGSAYVGYREFRASSAGFLPGFNGIVADLGLSYTLLGMTSFGVTYQRDLTYSYSELQPFFVHTTIGASVRRALGERFDVLVSGDWHKYDYRNALTADLDTLLRLDRTAVATANIGYRLNREARIGFGVTYVRRDSPITSRQYENLRFGATVSFGL